MTFAVVVDVVVDDDALFDSVVSSSVIFFSDAEFGCCFDAAGTVGDAGPPAGVVALAEAKPDDAFTASLARLLFA